ncbi:hypothetical protein ABZT49_07290 [Methylobacterium sp. EM32]|uniref:hypothetical protein n=1 Tax=Methylobacterium sp. EM32 TaxID=3163481 RepID=UPI0033BBD100
MLRLALMIPVLTAGLALAAPAAADGAPEAYRPAPAGQVRVRVRDERYRPAVRHVRRHDRPGTPRLVGAPVQPVSYGETDGTVFHAWLPRNTTLPIYNIPPPYFPEP